jgi:MYXO-CTERM domain-containing protein
MWVLTATWARSAPGDVLFSEDWTAGTGAWTASGAAIALITAEDDDGTTRTWQHETVGASGGRVFTTAPIPVVGGTTYCLSAWVHAETGGAPFLGFDLSDANGARSTEHWMIGRDSSNGYGGLVVQVSDDPNAWSPYAATFTVEPTATHVVLKDELWVNAAAGAVDFTGITLTEGACEDLPGDDTGDTGRIWLGPIDPGGCGCDAPNATPAAGLVGLAALALSRRRARGPRPG